MDQLIFHHKYKMYTTSLEATHISCLTSTHVYPLTENLLSGMYIRIDQAQQENICASTLFYLAKSLKKPTYTHLNQLKSMELIFLKTTYSPIKIKLIVILLYAFSLQFHDQPVFLIFHNQSS